MAGSKKSVLFVCLGNICRSTMAEGIFREIVKNNNVEEQWTIDSAGTGDYHIGRGPDKRTMTTLKKHNIKDYQHRARQVKKSDFNQFDYMLVMDDSNLEDVKDLKPGKCTAEIMKLGSFGKNAGFDDDVADPYYSTAEDSFEKVYEQCLKCCNEFFSWTSSK
eukprot:gene7170-7976_t